MPSKSAMGVSLTPELTQYISAKVATGYCRTTSEVVRAALRLLEQQDRRGESVNDTTVLVEGRRVGR